MKASNSNWIGLWVNWQLVDNVFNSAYFHEHGIINGDNTYGTLPFTEGKTYTLQNSKTQTINEDLVSTGTCSQLIILK